MATHIQHLGKEMGAGPPDETGNKGFLDGSVDVLTGAGIGKSY